MKKRLNVLTQLNACFEGNIWFSSQAWGITTNLLPLDPTFDKKSEVFKIQVASLTLSGFRWQYVLHRHPATRVPSWALKSFVIPSVLVSWSCPSHYEKSTLAVSLGHAKNTLVSTHERENIGGFIRTTSSRVLFPTVNIQCKPDTFLFDTIRGWFFRPREYDFPALRSFDSFEID